MLVNTLNPKVAIFFFALRAPAALAGERGRNG